MGIPMGRPEKRQQPSEPVTVNTFERFQGFLIKLDSEGHFYWTRPDTDCSVSWENVEACRQDIMDWRIANPIRDEASDTETEAA